MLWLSKYERQARLVPGLLVLLPVPVTIIALGLQGAPIFSTLGSLLSLVGGPVILASVIRSLGLAEQEKLWSEWNGTPTTKALRLREATPNSVQRDVWREAVEKLGNVRLSSRRQEAANPGEADQRIEAAVARIRELTRNSEQFPLVDAENRNYGMQRNLYAARNIGRGVALGALCITVAFMAWHITHSGGGKTGTSYIIGVLVNSMIVLAWFTVPSRTRVRIAAEKYAQQLLHASVTVALTKANDRSDG